MKLYEEFISKIDNYKNNYNFLLYSNLGYLFVIPVILYSYWNHIFKFNIQTLLCLYLCICVLLVMICSYIYHYTQLNAVLSLPYYENRLDNKTKEKINYLDFLDNIMAYNLIFSTVIICMPIKNNMLFFKTIPIMISMNLIYISLLYYYTEINEKIKIKKENIKEIIISLFLVSLVVVDGFFIIKNIKYYNKDKLILLFFSFIMGILSVLLKNEIKSKKGDFYTHSLWHIFGAIFLFFHILAKPVTI